MEAEFPDQELVSQLEALSVSMWSSLKNFGPSAPEQAAKLQRKAELEAKFRKLAKCLGVPAAEAFAQFQHVQDIFLREDSSSFR